MTVVVDRYYFESLQAAVEEKSREIERLQARSKIQEQSWARHKSQLNKGTCIYS